MKVFSTEKYILKEGKSTYDYFKRIVDMCEGKTEEEIIKLGYWAHADWMIEKGGTNESI